MILQQHMDPEVRCPAFVSADTGPTPMAPYYYENLLGCPGRNVSRSTISHIC